MVVGEEGGGGFAEGVEEEAGAWAEEDQVW